MRPLWIGAALALAVLCACSTLEINQDFDANAPFSSYRTYGWLTHEQEPTGNLRVDNPLLHRRIRDAIDRHLEIMGFRKLTDAEPDIWVGFHLSLEQRLDVRTINWHHGVGGYRRAGYWGSVGYETHVQQYEQGPLIIDIADAAARSAGGSGPRGRAAGPGSVSPRPGSANFRIAHPPDPVGCRLAALDRALESLSPGPSAGRR